jgi:16S rRNA (uracil1498-N3)-methyltransferase
VSQRRLVVPGEAIEGDRAKVRGSAHHHLCHVLRVRRGDRLELLDGSGARYEGEITDITAREVVVAIRERHPPPPSPLPRLVLVYGLSRRSRTELVLQKATELGVDWFLPAVCARSVARPEGKTERWLEIMTQATRQCGRPAPPLLSPTMPLADALTQAAGEAELRLIASGPDGEAISSVAGDLSTEGLRTVAAAVGPEGGFSPDELATAGQRGFRTVSLGPLVLRTETAAVSMLTLLAFLSGRLSPSEG